MEYSREIYAAAMAEVEQRRAAAGARAAVCRETMTARIPRLREIEQEMSHAAVQVTRAVLDGGNDIEAAVEPIKNRNLALQTEMAEILAKEGFAFPDFEPQYTCMLCGDTGYAAGKPCDCLQKLMQEYACREMSELTTIPYATFEELQLSYYSSAVTGEGLSPRRRMEETIRFCKSYAEKFHLPTDSLLMRGPTGTGKTHLSAAIARVVTGKGFGVIYGPAQVLLHRIEKEHFGKTEGNSEDRMTGCDLLILDDVGTEFASPFYISCFYNLINTRMLENRPTIISTNLSQTQLRERYGDQITSRITGTFLPILFVGKDIRQLKNQKRLNTSIE